MSNNTLKNKTQKIGMSGLGEGPAFSIQGNNFNQSMSNLYPEANSATIMDMMDVNDPGFSIQGNTIQPMQSNGLYTEVNSASFLEEAPGHLVNSFVETKIPSEGYASASGMMQQPGFSTGSIIGAAPQGIEGYGSGLEMYSEAINVPDAVTIMERQDAKKSKKTKAEPMQQMLQQEASFMESTPTYEEAYNVIDNSINDVDVETILIAYQLLKKGSEKIGKISNQIFSAAEYCTGNQFSVGGITYEGSISNCSNCFQYVSINIDDYAEAILVTIQNPNGSNGQFYTSIAEEPIGNFQSHFQMGGTEILDGFVNVSPTSSGNLAKKKKNTKNEFSYMEAPAGSIKEKAKSSKNEFSYMEAPAGSIKEKAKSSKNEFSYMEAPAGSIKEKAKSSKNEFSYMEAVPGSIKNISGTTSKAIKEVR